MLFAQAMEAVIFELTQGAHRGLDAVLGAAMQLLLLAGL